MRHLKLGVYPILFLLFLTLILIVLDINPTLPNVPYLKLILNIIFLTTISIYVMTISGISYINFGAIGLLIISNIFLIIGTAFLISGLTGFVSVDYATAIQDIGLLIASLLQVSSAIMTISTTSSSEPTSRKITLGATYFTSIVSIGFIIVGVLLGLAPNFFTEIGATLIDRAVLIVALFFFTIAGFFYLWHYLRSKEEALLWYSLALFLFALCSLSFIFQTNYGLDLHSWIGTIALYIGSIYFLTSILQLRRGMEPSRTISERWAESLTLDRKQTSALFANMVSGFAYNKIILDENGKPIDMIILEANNAYERIIGMSKFKFIGKKISIIYTWPTSADISAAERISFLETFGKVALEGNPIDTEYYFAPLKKWLHITAYSPKKYYFITMFEDITERKELEKKINDYTKDLEKLVEERTKQLQESERLVTIGQTAGMIGHDIRNPLQAITNELFVAKQAAQRQDESKESKDMRESISLIEDQIDYISKIVADLQDYSRPLNPELSIVNLPEVISSVLQTALEKGNEVSVNVDGDFEVTTDSVFIKRILGNLVSNSIQAMPEGGKLNISACRKEKQVIITVSDTGKGIPEATKSKIFKPLFTTKAKGQGLGLSVVKRLVEALNGTITFDSQEGKGTKFTIVFPYLENQKL